MTNWKPIQTAPQDGRRVWVRRVYEGRLVKEGFAVWSTLAEDAAARRPIYSPPFYPPLDETQADRDRFADTWRWLLPCRQFLFPEPTEWREHVELDDD
jgi:hypothetical protein